MLLGGALPGSGVGVGRRPRRFWLRCSSWHWAPRGQRPLREKSGHSSVCFFLHCGGGGDTLLGEPGKTPVPHGLALSALPHRVEAPSPGQPALPPIHTP